MIDNKETQAKYYELIHQLPALKNQYKRVEVIREIYKMILPELKREGFKTFQSEYPIAKDFLFLDIYTPIEKEAFEIFYYKDQLPIFPQYPIFEYLVDFAIPTLKIAIEIDGKQHDFEKDYLRDKRLFDAGWKVFRIKGRECFKYQYFDEIVELDEDGEIYRTQEVEEFFMNTLEGVSLAIKTVYFSDNDGCYELSKTTLEAHSNFHLQLKS